MGRQRLLPVLLATSLLGIVLGACSSGSTLQTDTGIVIAIDSKGLAQVDGFTLRKADGTEMTFDTTDTRFDASGFPPQHLQEHRALGLPVKVTYQVRDGVDHVVKLQDAGG